MYYDELITSNIKFQTFLRLKTTIPEKQNWEVKMQIIQKNSYIKDRM